MTFHVGQKVVCVDPPDLSDCLKRGQVYTCVAMEDIFLGVDCCSEPDHHCGWFRDRFRPVVERKTSIEIFTAMLKPSKVEA